MLYWLLDLIRRELDKPEVKQELLSPFTKWVFWNMLPYAIGIICLNFFFTIAAVSLVLYLYNRSMKNNI